MEGPPLGPGGEGITWPDQVAPRCRKASSTRKIKRQTSNCISWGDRDSENAICQHPYQPTVTRLGIREHGTKGSSLQSHIPIYSPLPFCTASPLPCPFRCRMFRRLSRSFFPPDSGYHLSLCQTPSPLPQHFGVLIAFVLPGATAI